MTDNINDYYYVTQFISLVEEDKAEIAEALSGSVQCYLQEYQRETRTERTQEHINIIEEITRLVRHLRTMRIRDRGRALLGYTLKNEEQLPKEFTVLFNTAQKLEWPFSRYTPTQNFKYLVDNKGMRLADALLAITTYYYRDRHEKQKLTQQNNLYEELQTYLKLADRKENQFLLSYPLSPSLPADFMEMVEEARARELMLQYGYLVREKKKNLANALLEIVDKYSFFYVDGKTRQERKDEVCVELERLKAHLKAEPKVGGMLLGYTFQHAMPQDFMKLFEGVKGLEQKRVDFIRLSVLNSPSYLVMGSENAVAASSYSVETLFAETAKLEEAMLKNEDNPIANPLSEKHKDKIIEKIQQWTNELTQKIAELIIKAMSAEHLTHLIEVKLKDELISPAFGLADLKKEILSQVEYLEKCHFFKPGYSKLRLADKHQYVQDFSLELKNKNALPRQLEVTFLCFLEAIEKEAYAPFQKQKNQLMDSPDATTSFVFGEIENALNQSNLQFRNKNLFEALKKSLQKDKEQAKDWERVSEHLMLSESNPYHTYHPLMREIYGVKYTFPIGQDPRALLPKPVIIHRPVPIRPTPIRPSQKIKDAIAEAELICDELEQYEDKENSPKSIGL